MPEGVARAEVDVVVVVVVVEEEEEEEAEEEALARFRSLAMGLAAGLVRTTVDSACGGCDGCGC